MVLRALQGPPGPPKGAFWAKTGPFGAPWGPGETQYRGKVCGNHNSNPVGLIGGSLDQIRPPGALQDPRGPPKGSFGAKTGPFGAQRRPNTRPKCVVTMTPTQSDQLGAVGTKSGPRGPSKTLGDPQKGLSGPKRALLGALECSRGPKRGPSA